MIVTITFDSAVEALTILTALAQLDTAAEPAVDELCAPEPADGRYPIEDPHNQAPSEAAPKKKRGRPKKVQPETVVVSAESDVLAPVETVVPAEIASGEITLPVEEIPAAVETKADEPTILTGEHVQDYIMALIHQHRIDPQAVKERVYPKYGVARAFDLKPDQVAAAKADIDKIAKPAKSAAPSNDLDL